MDIPKKDIEINQILRGASFLGSGASKEAFEKDGVVYKVPRGRYFIEKRKDFYIKYPDSMDEVNDFLFQLEEYNPAIVWPIGQFAMEILIWKAIKQLESEGLNIDCFARIYDYFLDRNNVIVIKQELTEYIPCGNDREKNEKAMYDLAAELKVLAPILEERFNIVLRDIRYGNCGYANGRLKLFDFGISTTTDLDNYDGYSACDWDECNDDY